MTAIKKKRHLRICQGDIFREIEYIEFVREKRGILEVSKIVFPYVVVLTQDCDLKQDYSFREPTEESGKTQDKLLISVLVAPLYNAEHVYLGEHMSDLGMKMEPVNRKRSPGTYLRLNERPRYHYLSFPQSSPLVDSVVDFKHYFSVNVSYLLRMRAHNYICTVAPLHREDLSVRFAGYLARIGLPEPSVS